MLGLALLASSLTPALAAPAKVSAQPYNGVTIDETTSVTPHPDHVRVDWTDPDQAPPPPPTPPTMLSVRDNDELVFGRCATRANSEHCIELTATCGAVFDDMESLHRLLDGLSAKIKQNWDSQMVGTGEMPGKVPDFKLPDYESISQIGLAELLQASWALLPVRWRFLNWDAAFISGTDIGDPTGFAETLSTAFVNDAAEISRDYAASGLELRDNDSARNQINTADIIMVNPRDVAEWVTDRPDHLPSRVAYPFPTFALGALLDPATLARQVDFAATPDTSTALGAAVNRLTGGASLDGWAGTDAQAFADWAGTDLQSLKVAASNLSSGLAATPGSAIVPYTVRAVLAFLKIIAEHPTGILSGFSKGKSYEPYQFPFQVLFEAPDLTAGLLELFGLDRPAYRSVRDIGIAASAGDTPYFEERAESLLVEMFDFCANKMVIHDDRFLRWEDPAASLATFARGDEDPLRDSSGFDVHRSPDSSPPTGSRLELTGLSMGETTLWYCYSFELSGCAGAWTPITVLVEPAGWNDARVVIQRDHFHVVVDWNSGKVMVLRPSDSARAVHTITTTGWPSSFALRGRGISASGTWIGDVHERDYIPKVDGGLKYEKVSEYCCLTDPTSDWSFEVVLPVLDNDEVHFYDKPDPDKPAGPANELRLLAGVAGCTVSRYCEHVRTHLLPGRGKLPSRGEIALDAGDTAGALTARISSRRTALGTTENLFANNKKHQFDWFTLSYCVAALNVDCLNWTDRRKANVTTPPEPIKLKQGHCVIATSLRDPVAPNAPSALTVREWARRTGRPQGEFYFARSFAALEYDTGTLLPESEAYGWNSALVRQSKQVQLRNYECPALDPQNPRLAADWKPKTDDSRKSSCNGVKTSPGSDGGGKIHRMAQTLEYKAYRRFWNCHGADIGRTAEVASYGGSNRRVAHPTENNVFVTLEFIDPTTSVCSNPPSGEVGYCDDTDLDTALISANCATDGSTVFNSVPQPSSWPLDTSMNIVKWEINPSLPDDRKIQLDTPWCHALVPCWNDAGELLQTVVVPPATAALADRTEPAGCEDPVPTACQSFHRVILSSGGSCTKTAAADFALEQGCVAPGTTADRLQVLATSTDPNKPDLLPPGWGVLTSGHYRWANPTHGGAFSNTGGQTDFKASTDRTADDPGVPLFSVSSGLAVDALWEFCQGATMTVVGVWPTYPSTLAVDKFPHWPAGACDGIPTDTDPVYEIDDACEDSYPRLYDSDRTQAGIQLDDQWKQCLEGPPGLQPESSGCAEVVPGCVGEDECADWVIPRPGFYRVRVLVDIPPVAKTGHAKAVADAAASDLAAAADPADFAPGNLLTPLNAAGGSVVATDLGADGAAQQSAAKMLAEPHWGPSDGDPATVEDPEPFVFDQVIWAQSFFTGSA